MVLSSALNRLAGTVYTHVTLSKRTIRKYARRAKSIETDNATLKESAYLADVAFQSLKEHHDFHFGKLEAKLAAHLENEGDECPLCKLEEELNTLQQGYLGRGDAIKILHSWIMEDKNKIGELEEEIKERDQEC